ncbi:MAG: CDP-diacylglycerol--serine O-phosphatidyltransferase [Bacteroidales bacterium]|nr:CDP-diacylglycerol--serine O-phosphatidyltransferase [Bacteroidales bacterium]
MKLFISIKNSIPNFLTLMNLFSGCLSILATVEGYPIWSGVFIFIAAGFDFLDGFVARLLKATSSIGKELDSLADLISFGLAPAFIVFGFLKSVLLINHIESDDFSWVNIFILASPFLIALFSALRLAKFNIDERQTSEFIGLPTPANAIFFAWLPIILSSYDLTAFFIILNLKSLIFVTILHSFLLVSPFPMFSLKIKSFHWKGNQIRYIFIAATIILILFLKLYSVPFIIWLYILTGIIRYIILLKNSKTTIINH